MKTEDREPQTDYTVNSARWLRSSEAANDMAARVLDKLQTSVRAGNYYEAHQMYRSLYFRYLGQKKYADLLTLLNQGSLVLLEKDQQGSGVDLSILLVDVLVKSKTTPTDYWIEKLGQLLHLISPSIPERDTFITNAVKWSMDENKRGHPLLHKFIAEVLWKEKKYSAAHRHFLYSADGTAYAKFLIEIQNMCGFKREVDLFIGQAVFRLLCLRDFALAKSTFISYAALHPLIKSNGPQYGYPLLNFIWFLFKAIEERKTGEFKLINACYTTTLKRDLSFRNYLETIGHIWLGIELPLAGRHNNSSMFGGLLKSILGDVDSSGDEADVRPGTSRNHARQGPELD